MKRPPSRRAGRDAGTAGPPDSSRRWRPRFGGPAVVDWMVYCSFWAGLWSGLAVRVYFEALLVLRD